MDKAKIISTLDIDQLSLFVVRQLNCFFPDSFELSPADICSEVTEALTMVEHCFSYVDNKYYFNGANILFNHLNGDQYAVFLYFLSRIMYKRKFSNTALEKVYLLNKVLHGVDIYFEVELPSVFLLIHPLGTVLGRAKYSDFLMVYQRCGVGSNQARSPEIGLNVTLHPGASVLGKSRIGENSTLASNSLLIDKSIKENCTYYGDPKNHFIMPNKIRPKIWRGD